MNATYVMTAIPLKNQNCSWFVNIALVPYIDPLYVIPIVLCTIEYYIPYPYHFSMLFPMQRQEGAIKTEFSPHAKVPGVGAGSAIDRQEEEEEVGGAAVAVETTATASSEAAEGSRPQTSEGELTRRDPEVRRHFYTLCLYL